MNEQLVTSVRERFRCLNCGYQMEIRNPCHSCGDGQFKCLFCGEHMSKQW
jgi:hypothetical protein